MREKLIEEYFEVSVAMQRAWKARIMAELNDEQISIAQMGILFLLKETQPILGKDLAARLYITRSAVTQLIDGLVDSGYVTRTEDSKDRRKIYLSLSKRGSAKLKALDKQRKAVFMAQVANLSDKQLTAAIEINAQMLKEIET